MTYPDQNGSVRNHLASVVSADRSVATLSDFDQSSTAPTVRTATSRGGVKNDTAPSCRTGYLRNINVFVVAISLTFFVRGAMLQYSEDVLFHIGRRYPITNMELEFVIGCERIGFVVTLLFVAFFGNRLHKPIAISIGIFLCAMAAVLMAVPFFLSGPRLYEGKISQFATAGLCKQTHRNVSFQTQCDLIVFKEDDGARSFSIICFAKFLVGVGGALYASLGIVYIDEASKPAALPLYLGTVICMHGLGRFVGNLLAAWFSTLPEAMNFSDSIHLQQSFAVYDQERVGRWWLGYPIFFSLFLCLSFLTLWFPKHLVIPDWILRRKTRRAKLQAEYDRKVKMKLRAAAAAAAKKRHSAEVSKKKKKNSKKSSKSSERNGQVDRNSKGIEEEQEDGTLGVINEIDPTEDEFQGETQGEAMSDGEEDPRGDQGDSVGANGYGNGESKLYPGLDNEGYEPVDTGADIPPETASLEVNMEDSRGEERIGEVEEEEEEKRARKNHRSKEKSQNGHDGKNGFVSEKSSSGKKKQTSSNPTRRHVTSPVSYRRKRIRFRKEQLKDLPHSLWKLLHNMRVLIIMLGAILGGFFFNGYLATLPEYIHVQFERTWSTSIILAGVMGPLAWGLGTLIGGILMYRYRALPLSKVTLAVVACILLSCLFTTINMGFHCSHDTSPNETSIATCGYKCECDSYKVQYEPLCGQDGKTYPSPCHAGCRSIHLTSTPGVFNFTGCACVNGGHALQGACVPQCSQVVGFGIVTFLSVLVASIGIVPVFILLFRGVRSRSRSLAAGFAIWGVYTFSQTLGPVVFRYVRRGRCLRWGQDCLEADICWRYELGPYRYIVNGLAASFLFAASIPFLLVYWRLMKDPPKPSKSNSRPTSMENRDSGDVLSGTEQSTQTADVSELYVIVEKSPGDVNDNEEVQATSHHI